MACIKTYRMKFTRSLGGLLFLTTSLLTAQAPHYEDSDSFKPPSDVVFYYDVIYCEGNDAWKVDIAVPADATGSLPAVVACHGGGWRVGDKNGQRGLITRFAQNGYVGVGIRYRLSGEAPFPACVEDVKSAVRWVRANAQDYHIDAEKIGAIGHSAGAHLAAMLGLAPVEAGLDKGCNLGYSSLVNAVCGLATPTDFIHWGEDKGEPNGPKGLLAGPEESISQRAIQASPVTYVNPDAPPFLLVHGSADRTVPVIQVKRLASGLRAAGAANTYLVVLDSLDHDFMISHETLVWPMIISFFDATIGPRGGSLSREVTLSQEFKTKRRKPGGFQFDDIKHFDHEQGW